MKFTQAGISATGLLLLCGGICFAWLIFSTVLGNISYNHTMKQQQNRERYEANLRRLQKIPRKSHKAKVRTYKVSY